MEPVRAAAASVLLPGRTEPVEIESPVWAPSYPPPASRRVYAAAHVAATPDGEIDWDATLAFRDHLWSYGFGVAEAMDTAQRGGGLTWDQARDLITRSAARAAKWKTNRTGADPHADRDAAWSGADRGTDHSAGRSGTDRRPNLSAERNPNRSADLSPDHSADRNPDRSADRNPDHSADRNPDRSADRNPDRSADRSGAVIAAGASTDQLGDGPRPLAEIVAAYREQVDMVQDAGAQVILMASRSLAASAHSAEDYLDVYIRVLGHAERPVMLHWLGPAFDPALRGYWGSDEYATAADTVVELINRADGQVSGIKLSLLDAGKEIALRRRLPPGTRMFTGDDFNYADLIRGDAAAGGPGQSSHAGGDVTSHSDALLGAFAAITAPAAAALHALDNGDVAGYDTAIGPTVPLSRALFEHPTSDYKAGVAFLAWLNGLQPYFAMLGQMQHRRSPAHLIRVFELAAAAGALTNPLCAAERMHEFLGRTGTT